MKIVNFGSLNIDHVYQVNRFVEPGETLECNRYQQLVGGKGLNQSLAIARAGAPVMHVGSIGTDGLLLQKTLADSGVDVSQLQVQPSEASGHAIIQVDAKGENCILYHGGANQTVSVPAIDGALALTRQNDIVLIQNEINNVPAIIDKAAAKNLTIVFNPAPMSTAVLNYPLEKVDYFIVNQSEAQALSQKSDIHDILTTLSARYPASKFILTLGAQGAIYQDPLQQIIVPAITTDTVDTTAAGDTFIGYFVAELSARKAIKQCLETACKAASLCVQTIGAANSIPYRRELDIV